MASFIFIWNPPLPFSIPEAIPRPVAPVQKFFAVNQRAKCAKPFSAILILRRKSGLSTIFNLPTPLIEKANALFPLCWRLPSTDGFTRVSGFTDRAICILLVLAWLYFSSFRINLRRKSGGGLMFRLLPGIYRFFKRNLPANYSL